MIPFTGGCVCAAIRYECTAEPIMTFKCHCHDCQRVTGGGLVAGLLVAASAFRLTKGQLRYHFTPGAAGGRHKRGFCAECGSRLTGGESDERPPGFIGVTAGNALFPTDQAVLPPGGSVLLEGTGGVSIFALQLAHAAGLRTIITSGSAAFRHFKAGAHLGKVVIRAA